MSPGIVLRCSKHFSRLDYENDLVNPACNPFVSASESAATAPNGEIYNSLHTSYSTNCDVPISGHSSPMYMYNYKKIFFNQVRRVATGPSPCPWMPSSSTIAELGEAMYSLQPVTSPSLCSVSPGTALEHHPQGDLEPDDASPIPAANEEAARFSEKS